MLVLCHGVEHHIPIAAAHRNHRYFAHKIDKRLDDELRMANRVPRLLSLFRCFQHRLPFAVVAFRDRFGHYRATKLSGGGSELLSTFHHAIGRRGNTQAIKQRFLFYTVLAHRNSATAGINRLVLLNLLYQFNGEVLEFIGHYIDLIQKRRQMLVLRVDNHLADTRAGI